MTRRMADSVTAANLPAGFDFYAGYVDGNFKNFAQIEEMYPGKTVPIAVFSTTNAGIVGDCETGDMTPQTAVSWVVMRRKAGVDPTIYCSYAAWGGVQQAFSTAGVAQPHYWIAAYPGNGANLYPGSVAHQWIDRGPYDESVVADYWPGVDAPPIPDPPQGASMAVTQTVTFRAGQWDVFQVAGGALWHKWTNGQVWANESLSIPGITFTGDPQVSIIGGSCSVTVEDTTEKVWFWMQGQTGPWQNSRLP